MPKTFQLHQIGRLPLPQDNVAIATQKLDAGTQIINGEQSFSLSHTILEGHRFAIAPLNIGDDLLSWGLPFGEAIAPLESGQYLCNEGMLEALQGRRLDFPLPVQANFKNKLKAYCLDKDNFQAASPLPLYDDPPIFMGYQRPNKRGVGTRNFIILLGTSSLSGGYVRQLETRLKGLADDYDNIDGIVAVAHTEGGTANPNNLDMVLRTLAGFMVHPNVGAVLAVDYGSEPLTNHMLKTFMTKQNYALADVPHAFMSLKGAFMDNLAQGETLVKDWLATVNAYPRTTVPLTEMKLALQCGGSDAFSGISGNPLAGWVAKEIIRSGGAANLAETDELIGAESYALQKVRSVETAERFLAMIARFRERAAWHGSSAEGNPSGGNKFRGLYNIVLKSIGAAMKRHPDVPLDYAIDYSQPMQNPGYYFMDSPGNDLESIAGQVAAGCNMIYFVTGNGSITNFPFVPTIKIVTTSKRFALLSNDMDVNAGAYLDGTSMDDLGQQTLDLTLRVASGERSVGEKAGHAQVQLWRNWSQTDDSQLDVLLNQALPTGQAIPLSHTSPAETANIDFSPYDFSLYKTENGLTLDQVGLILPTSLCSGQIARLIADKLNRQQLGQDKGLSRFVSLAHTEGCGASSGSAEDLYVRTMMGYLSHPLVRYCVLLEHGCEKTHNDYMRHYIEDLGLNPQSYGWASVQLDGGIQKATHKITTWFEERLAQTGPTPRVSAGLGSLRVGLMSDGEVEPSAATALASLSQIIVAQGGTVVVPDKLGPVNDANYNNAILPQGVPSTSLAYAQRAENAGFHIMEAPSAHWVETLSGLGATGVDVVLAYAGQYPLQTHPLVPVLQITANQALQSPYGADFDLILNGSATDNVTQILTLLEALVNKEHSPHLYNLGNVDFQITRGLLGLSL